MTVMLVNVIYVTKNGIKIIYYHKIKKINCLKKKFLNNSNNEYFNKILLLINSLEN